MQRSTLADDLTHDAFLGGRLHIYQPRKGYRAGTDPVMLAASVDAKAGQSVLELGCGVGTAALCLHARIPGLTLTGVEVQPSYATLAERNVTAAQAKMTVVCADLRRLPADLRQLRFDHVMMNPPYFDRDKGHASTDTGRDIALGGETPLADWLDIGIRRLAPKGYLTIIQKMDRLPEVIAALSGRLGSVVVRPIAPRPDAPANLFLLQARQEGRAPFQMSAPVIMHADDGYSAEVEDVLRNGAKLTIQH